MMEQTNGLVRDCRLRTGDGGDLIIPRFLLEASSLFFASLFRYHQLEDCWTSSSIPSSLSHFFHPRRASQHKDDQ